MRTLLLIAVLASPLLAGEKPLLDRLVAKDEAVREAARDEWDGLEEEARFRLAHANLRSENDEIAWICADELTPWRLNLEEIRLRAAILARNTRHYLLPDGEGKGDVLGSLGAPDLADFWRDYATLTIPDPARYFGDGEGWHPADTFRQTHRQMGPDHLPVLASLLEVEDPTVFEEIFWTLMHGSEFTDRHRDTVARACLYALARFQAMQNEDPLPRMTDFAVDTPAEGLPAAFVTLARQTWLGVPKLPPLRSGFDRWCADGRWLRRWAWDLNPTKKDVPFLLDVTKAEKRLDARAWAVHALASLEDPRAQAFVRVAATGTSDLAAFAAAELARRGRPERFLELLQGPEPSQILQMLAFDVAPDVLRRLFFNQQAEPGEFPDWSVWEDPSDLTDFEAGYNVRIPPETFRPFLQQALAADPPHPGLIFLLEPYPELFTREMLADPIGRIVARPPLTEDEWFSMEGQQDTFAHLELRAPDLLSELLCWLAKSSNSEIRFHALRLQARARDTRCLEPILKDFDWFLESEGFDTSVQDAATALGALRDPRVKKLMEARARSEDRVVAFNALLALCAHAELNESLERTFTWASPDGLDEEEFAAFRKAALDGDAVGACFVLVKAGAVHEDALSWLGVTKDPRVLEHLRGIRKDRGEQYWLATGGLALAGDEAATRELLGWVRDGRTVMCDDLEELLAVAMEVDPSIVDLQIERLESNCCRGFYATVALGQRFPTLDVRYQMDSFLQTKRRIREWYDRHRGTFRWSRIAGGWVPGE